MQVDKDGDASAPSKPDVSTGAPDRDGVLPPPPERFVLIPLLGPEVARTLRG
jgi:hypothetical protein